MRGEFLAFLGDVERAAWVADGSGIPPGAGVGIVDPQPLADLGLTGLQCLRALWAGEGADAQRVRKGVEETRATSPRAGSSWRPASTTWSR